MQYKIIALCLCFMASLAASAQDVMSVKFILKQRAEAKKIDANGVERTEMQLQPLYQVRVRNESDKQDMGYTNFQGVLVANVRSNATISFSRIGLVTQTVKVKGRDSIEVVMKSEDNTIADAEVVYKRERKKPRPRQSKIRRHGNYYYVDNIVEIPQEMIKPNIRVVSQPIMYNVGGGRRDSVFLRPIVVDTRNYNRTQRRMYDFKIDSLGGDPFASVKRYTAREKGSGIVKDSTYISTIQLTKDSTFMRAAVDSSWVDDLLWPVKVEKTKLGSWVYSVRDAMWIKQPDKADVYTDTYMTVEDYSNLRYCSKTTVAQGAVDPSRWLDYSFGASAIKDSTLFPKDVPQLRNSKGNIDLMFIVGKAAFDPENPHNKGELEKLRRDVDNVANMPGAKLYALDLAVTSSPEGGYSKNLSLANERKAFALNFLKEQVPAEVRSGMKFSSTASVAKWSDMIPMLRADSLNDLADQIEDITSRYRNPDAQSRLISRLPQYSGVIKTKYLPRMRTMSYKMDYTIYRMLTKEEILEKYAQDVPLTEYEYFKLYREEPDTAKCVKILRKALKEYPSFIVAANDLQSILIAQHKAESGLLAPFCGEKAPVEVNMNHAVALMANGEYEAADTALFYVPKDYEEGKLLFAINGVKLGLYEENFDVVANTSTLNRVVMLLLMGEEDKKYNAEAQTYSEQLPDSVASTHYLRAICYYRNKSGTDAEKEIRKAIKMDPSLEAIALMDGDLNKLPMFVDKNKENKGRSNETVEYAVDKKTVDAIMDEVRNENKGE